MVRVDRRGIDELLAVSSAGYAGGEAWLEIMRVCKAGLWKVDRLAYCTLVSLYTWS